VVLACGHGQHATKRDARKRPVTEASARLFSGRALPKLAPLATVLTSAEAAAFAEPARTATRGVERPAADARFCRRSSSGPSSAGAAEPGSGWGLLCEESRRAAAERSRDRFRRRAIARARLPARPHRHESSHRDSAAQTNAMHMSERGADPAECRFPCDGAVRRACRADRAVRKGTTSAPVHNVDALGAGEPLRLQL
jgi:hypothetical protein